MRPRVPARRSAGAWPAATSCRREASREVRGERPLDERDHACRPRVGDKREEINHASAAIEIPIHGPAKIAPTTAGSAPVSPPMPRMPLRLSSCRSATSRASSASPSASAASLRRCNHSIASRRPAPGEPLVHRLSSSRGRERGASPAGGLVEALRRALARRSGPSGTAGFRRALSTCDRRASRASRPRRRPRNRDARGDLGRRQKEGAGLQAHRAGTREPVSLAALRGRPSGGGVVPLPRLLPDRGAAAQRCRRRGSPANWKPAIVAGERQRPRQCTRAACSRIGRAQWKLVPEWALGGRNGTQSLRVSGRGITSRCWSPRRRSRRREGAPDRAHRGGVRDRRERRSTRTLSPGRTVRTASCGRYGRSGRRRRSARRSRTASATAATGGAGAGGARYPAVRRPRAVQRGEGGVTFEAAASLRTGASRPRRRGRLRPCRDPDGGEERDRTRDVDHRVVLQIRMPKPLGITDQQSLFVDEDELGAEEPGIRSRLGPDRGVIAPRGRRCR